MSNVKLAGNVSGTGSVTIASPNTNSDFTIALPASNGTMMTTDTSISASQIPDGSITAAKLANTAVTAGSYTYSSITVDAQGRLTAASSGASPSAFPTGTAMMFVQTSAPTGWTKSTTHDNKALRVVSGTASSGGSSAFTTAFGTPSVSGSVSVSGTVGATTLTESQMPSHSHTIIISPSTSGGAILYDGRTAYQNTQSGRIGNTGGSGSHTHSFSGSGSLSSATASINVQYVDVIIATKD